MSQSPSSSNPAPASTVAPRPSSTTVSVTASSKEFRRLLRDFGYHYCLIESDKDDIIEASDTKVLSEMYSKLEDHLVSSSFFFFVCSIFIDLFIEAHARNHYTDVPLHEPWLGSFMI